MIGSAISSNARGIEFSGSPKKENSYLPQTHIDLFSLLLIETLQLE